MDKENPWIVKSLQDFQTYICPKCDFENPVQSEFIEHALDFHEGFKESLLWKNVDKYRYYNCPECIIKSVTKSGFIKHAVTNHKRCDSLLESLVVVGDNDVTHVTEDKSSVTNSDQTVTPVTLDEVTGETSVTLDEVTGETKDKSKVTELGSSVTDDDADVTELPSTTTQSTDSKRQCSVCPNIFETSKLDAFMVHFMHYHGLKKCCLEVRHSKTAFKNHIKFFHSRVIRKSKVVKIGGSNNDVTPSSVTRNSWKVRKHTCDSCQKWFKTDNELTIHVLSFHRRLIRQQACCHGKLSRESFIHHHIQCHSNLPKVQKVAILKEIHVFLCLNCPQQFYRKEDLKNHEDLVHSSVTHVTPISSSVSPVTPNTAQDLPIITSVTQVTSSPTSMTQVTSTATDVTQDLPIITNVTQVTPSPTSVTQNTPINTSVTQVTPIITSVTQVTPIITSVTQVTPTTTSVTQDTTIETSVTEEIETPNEISVEENKEQFDMNHELKNIQLLEDLDKFKAYDIEFKDFQKCQLCDYNYYNRLDLCRHFIDHHLEEENIKHPSNCKDNPKDALSQKRHNFWTHCDLSSKLQISEFWPTSNDLQTEERKKIDLNSLANFDFRVVLKTSKCEFCGCDFGNVTDWKKAKCDHLIQHFSLKDYCPCILEESQENWGFSDHISTFYLDLFEAFHSELGDKWCQKWSQNGSNKDDNSQMQLYQRLTEYVEMTENAFKSSTFQYTCPQCTHHFQNKDQFEQHIKAIHPDLSIDVTPVTPEIVTNTKKPNVFATKSKSSKNVTPQNVTAPKSVTRTENVTNYTQCTKCGHVCGSETALITHIMGFHAGMKNLQPCCILQNSKEEFMRHIMGHANANDHKTYGTKQVSYQCNQCNQHFTSEDSLNKHIFAIHMQRTTNVNSNSVTSSSVTNEAPISVTTSLPQNPSVTNVTGVTRTPQVSLGMPQNVTNVTAGMPHNVTNVTASMPQNVTHVTAGMPPSVTNVTAGIPQYVTSTAQASVTNALNTSGINVTLQEPELWDKFHKLPNEMIVTKNGRRMFPLLKVALKGLDPSTLYTIHLEFRQIGQDRHKYIHDLNQWTTIGGKESEVTNPVYTHPDSPNYGSHWCEKLISFAKVKLTNKLTSKDKVMLNSMHKYEPCLYVCRVDQVANLTTVVKSFAFPKTQFIAVTAYQNEEVTNLKIKFNSYAHDKINEQKIKEEIVVDEDNEGPTLQLSEPMTIPQEAYVSMPQLNESENIQEDQENVDPESKKRKIEDDFAYSKKLKDCGKPEKLLECTKCTRKFISEKNLKIHMTIQH